MKIAVAGDNILQGKKIELSYSHYCYEASCQSAGIICPTITGNQRVIAHID